MADRSSFQPITITRFDSDHYRVGSVDLIRLTDDVEHGRWTANPVGGGRRLFMAPTLEEILDMAHGAVEMMRPADDGLGRPTVRHSHLPADHPARFRDDYDPEPDYSRPTRYDIGPDGEV